MSFMRIFLYHMNSVCKLVILTLLVLCLFSSCNAGNEQIGSKVAKVDTLASVKGEPFIIELVATPGGQVDTALLKAVCLQNGLEHPDLYKWKDHYVVYTNGSNPQQLGVAIRSAFPSATVRIYEAPFYEFNRARCPDQSDVKDWDHILLTANLVKDTLLQKEYMTYHSTQFEKWPEVSNGFCNASFQQLLLFRNGRQLMLVISIPKGASLDELNPKTTENNPRVNEWNELMKKYQEGIQGTKPGEVWVFLEEMHKKQ